MNDNNNKSGECVKVVLYFHTKVGNKRLPPKIVMNEGKVCLPTNHNHRIRAGELYGCHFTDKPEQSILVAIKKAMDEAGVKVIPSSEARGYIKMNEDIETAMIELSNKFK